MVRHRRNALYDIAQGVYFSVPPFLVLSSLALLPQCLYVRRLTGCRRLHGRLHGKLGGRRLGNVPRRPGWLFAVRVHGRHAPELVRPVHGTGGAELSAGEFAARARL